MSYQLSLENTRLSKEQPAMPPVETEVVHQVVDTIEDNEIQAQPQEVESPQAEHEVVQERPQATNFRNLRAQLEQAQRERDEALRIAEEAYKRTNANVKEEPEFNLDLDDDNTAVQQLQKKINHLEQQQYQAQQQAMAIAIEAKIKAQFPDYDSVVTEESIALFKEYNPEMAAILGQSKDLYSKGVIAYKEIKRMGVAKSYDKQKEVVAKNLSKPRPASSTNPQSGSTPLEQANAFANGLTPELKQQLLKEMSAARKAI